MQVKKSNPTKTQVLMHIVADNDELDNVKVAVLKSLKDQVKVAGFREGKVPLEIVEKNIDPSILQKEFLEEAVERLYIMAAQENQLRPIDRPKIEIKKFVPFTSLEFDATVDVIGEIKLADYKKIKKSKPDVKVTKKDIDDVLSSLQGRLAEKKDVTRAAKDGDQVFIDFSGKDAKTKKEIAGADGKNYPLVIGSGTFIPGFEPELIGLKAGEEKTFNVTFPKDYGVATLQGKKVEFTVNVIKAQEVVNPKLDDEFAAKAGPFKTFADLKADIEKQLKVEKTNKANQDFESELVKEISDKSKLEVPKVLIDDQAERMLNELRQNVMYSGQTIQEYFESLGKTEEEYTKEVVRPQAEDRVKASLVLAEVAEAEKLDVTPEELEIRMQLLSSQYQDPQMQEELKKPETRRDIASRLLTEKTIQKLVKYATEK